MRGAYCAPGQNARQIAVKCKPQDRDAEIATSLGSLSYFATSATRSGVILRGLSEASLRLCEASNLAAFFAGQMVIAFGHFPSVRFAVPPCLSARRFWCEPF